MHKYLLMTLALLTPLISNAEIRDPTQPGNLPQHQLIDPQSGDTPLILTAIWISNEARRATINGLTLKTGQNLDDGTRILKIHPRYVLVRQHGVNKKLYLVQSVKKQ